jgi:choline dehydrogenase-like flavoprotein
MLLDAKQLQAHWFTDIVFDVCICGAGPAGITLARTLAGKGRRVALMEAGGLDVSHESQALYEGEIVGVPYHPLEICRLRYLGGTSNHWEGYTRPLDARDFEPLPHHPLQEWPIRRADLDPFATLAADILDLPSEQAPADLFHGQAISLTPTADRMSPPTRFGTKYRNELARSNLISLCLNANLVDIKLESGLRAVSEFIFRSYWREAPFKVQARCFVVCCGGLENARLLLNANRQMTPGIGNQHDLVGRFFCEHPEVTVGHALLASPSIEPSTYVASDALMLEQGCLSFGVSLEPLETDREGRWQHGNRPVCTPAFSDRLAQAVFSGSPSCFDVGVHAVTMQALNPESRVKLSDRRDRFGLRRLALDWRMTELDRHTIKTAALQMGRSLAEHNAGRMQLVTWLRGSAVELPDGVIEEGGHHMCTTRMSNDPKLGVVDRNCRVHGMENLFVAGSSVFASGGVSNPTYTIVQLALRLADHLERKLE